MKKNRLSTEQIRPILIIPLIIIIITFHVIACVSQNNKQETDRVKKIHQKFVFVDMHAHPERFHRANVERIGKEELNRYRRGMIDLIVCAVSTDAAFHGGYVNRDGTVIERLPAGEFYSLNPGDAYHFTVDRLDRINHTVEEGDAVLALHPNDVLKARKEGHLALIAALEGADGLEGDIENLRALYSDGLRLLQLVHFRANELGHVQTKPYKSGGLTPFGREVVIACNRLGIIIDLAHAHKETTMDALEVSQHPLLFSHTGVDSLYSGDRYLSDDEITAIAEKGGIIGIWPSASLGSMKEMVHHIDYVKNLVGIDHVGIGSDLRGMRVVPEFGEEADFRSIVMALSDFGYTEEEIGKVMGGNFFRLWQVVTGDH